ncbi:DUF421 domain-containing protein [Natronospora cellulosivora (SeqCode)]
MFIVIARTIILYSLVIIVLRIMGKRQIGELQPFEFAITIMISALAAIPMEDTGIPLVSSIIPILLLLAFQMALSIITLRSSKARAIICGKPRILIENGKLVEEELKNSRVNLNDLFEQLRLKGYPNISDVEFAILETNGKISVIPKSQKRPVNPEDLNIPTKYEGLSHSLVIDGEIQDYNLKKLNLNKEWLRAELAKYNIEDPSDTFFAALDTSGNLIYQKKRR